MLRRPWVQALGIQTVIDGGANVGHWAKACRLALPEATVCSFEPIPECQEKLRARMQGDKRHRVYPVALGRTSGELKLHLHAHASSSSLLPESDELRKLNKGTGAIREFFVPVTTLDELRETESWTGPILLKLDVQGYELEVIKGATNLMADVALVVAETSFRPLYRGQAVFGQMHSHLSNLGFGYHGSAGDVWRLPNGLELQQDSIFINERFRAQIG